MSMPQPSAVSKAAPRITSRWTLLAVALGFVMATLDVTVVNVALVSMQHSLRISLSGLTWIVDGYTLTFASLLLAGAAFANRHGAKVAYLSGLALFVLASLLCGLATSAEMLIGARLLQGVGAAMFMPSSLTLLALAYPDSVQRARVIGLWAAIVSIAAAMGPFVGGVLVAKLGWQSIFLLNLPIGVVGFILSYHILAASPRRDTHTNLLSHTLGFVSLAALSYTLIEGATQGWTSAPILMAATIAIVGSIGFVLHERQTTHPVIPTSLFGTATFAAANTIGFLLNFATFGLIFVLSLFFQQARGATPLQAGNQLLPMMAMFALANLLTSQLTARLGSKRLLLGGLLLAGIAICPLLTLHTTTSYGFLAACVCLSNIGVGMAVPAMTATVMQVAGSAHANIASATLNANRQLGALLGVAVMALVLHLPDGWYSNLKLCFTLVVLVHATASVLAWRFVVNSRSAFEKVVSMSASRS